MKELFSKFTQNFNSQLLIDEIDSRQKWWDYKNNAPLKELLKNLPATEAKLKIEEGNIKLQGTEYPEFSSWVEKLGPWKKGPFQYNDFSIDSEWKSDLKWQRIKDSLPKLEGQKLLDVGCNNGYYMYRMLEQNPEFVLGIDPVALYKAQFEFINNFVQAPNLFFELLGAEHIKHMKDLFDGIFYMGILYHHRDPISHLVSIREALKPGGWMLLETIGIPGEESICLSPKDRYAAMTNIWYVPTLNCLINWLERTKFVDIEVISKDWDGVQEQRVTEHGPGRSYESFLDPKNPELTIEGHPAPKRFAIMARRKK